MNACDDPRRTIPAIAELIEHPQASRLIVRHTRQTVLDILRSITRDIRQRPDGPIAPEPEAILEEACKRLEHRELDRLRPVVNATGILLHTGLGRAVLPPCATEALASLHRCCNLQIDLHTGRRGKRNAQTEQLVCEITGAEAALLVNNNAAATLLILTALCPGQEVVVSRGELIEIGGSFRLPDCITASGAIMREVGTTNKTHAHDYQEAISDATGALLRVNPSNYRMIGFTQRVPLEKLVALARAHNIPLIDDLGGGALVDLAAYRLPREPLVQESIAAGADLVCFSGDKLIGGPQAGILAGKRELITRIRQHPLTRMLRVGKLTDLALEHTLRLFREPTTLPQTHPLYHMLEKTADQVRRHAETLQQRIRSETGAIAEVTLEEAHSEIGGGTLPGIGLPTTLLALRIPGLSPAALARHLRSMQTPVITRLKEDRVMIDPRTLLPGDDDFILYALGKLPAAPASQPIHSTTF